MLYRYTLLLFLVVFISCQKQSQEIKEISTQAQLPKVVKKFPLKNLLGISVSQYQGNINWREVFNSSSQIQFVFVRATKGSLIQDTRFTQNWKALKKNNCIKGAYHYYLPNEDPITQFKNFASTVKLEKGDLPPVLDIEKLEGKDINIFLSEIQKWLDKTEKHFGVQPIIYSYLNFHNRYLKNHFKNYPIWMAMYSRKKKPKLEWNFHQFTDEMSISGIASFVCGEHYKDTKMSLQELCLKSTPVQSIDFSRNDYKKVNQFYSGNTNYVYGINFSQYQSKIHWQDLKINHNKIHFVFIRATEGTHRDSRFKQNWEKLKQLGYTRGAYHVYSPQKSINEQFKAFTSAVTRQKGDLPPVLSVGTVGKNQVDNVVKAVGQWLKRAEKHFRVKPLFCTNPYLYNRYFKDIVKGYPLWIVDYSDSQRQEKNQIKGIDWTFHQFNKTTQLKGVSKPVFANHYKGKLEDWNAYLQSISKK